MPGDLCTPPTPSDYLVAAGWGAIGGFGGFGSVFKKMIVSGSAAFGRDMDSQGRRNNKRVRKGKKRRMMDPTSTIKSFVGEAFSSLLPKPLGKLKDFAPGIASGGGGRTDCDDEPPRKWCKQGSVSVPGNHSGGETAMDWIQRKNFELKETVVDKETRSVRFTGYGVGPLYSYPNSPVVCWAYYRHCIDGKDYPGNNPNSQAENYQYRMMNRTGGGMEPEKCSGGHGGS